ncbi:MAG: signal peptidase II [Gammaproteobacteria bacterium]|jgi:signal peptidase II|nr:signal peptidase II [Gammaproteobacteria bacterium]HJL95673.1 signal peptidase II [SAR86 cluster bacterium]HJM58987.1 signal peptidase II [SAR86 cluster bacterium]|tara:strand:+ start:7523 stop:8008 length:486 start_codon:yes stop_codon:yes gene_type:complete
MSLLVNNKILFLLSLLAIDQLSKLLIIGKLSFGEGIRLLPFLDLTLVLNTGVAFSLLDDGGEMGRWLLVFIVLLVLIYMSYVLLKENLPDFEQLCLLLILGGGYGNLLDRAFRGHVIDFIHLYYKDYSFYVFNFADSYITIGVIIYIVGIIYTYKKERDEH